jgi:hypothetical protein
MAEDDASIRKLGMEVLIDGMGLANAQRFIWLIKRDSFDYARWREKLFEGVMVYEMPKKATDPRSKH